MNNKIKGMELSELYFKNVYLPVLEKNFSDLYERMAIGLAGEGSECFGYDDEISQDHDFGPSCCVWLTQEDYEKYGRKLSDVLESLPKEFMGFRGMETYPSNLYDWRLIPETALATVTNGKVFVDNLGKFTEIRNKLSEYFPEDIRLNKIATRCMKIAQSGQYNLPRCMKRDEIVAARMAETEFIDEAVHMIYLLNRVYKPFYKWFHRRLKELPILGEETHVMIGKLVKLPFDEIYRKVEIIEKICANIITEMKKQGIIEVIKSDFLLDYGPEIQKSITDEKLRNWSPWLD